MRPLHAKAFGLALTALAGAVQGTPLPRDKVNAALAAAVTVVRAHMKDPDAAKFRGVQLYMSSSDQPRICGEVNGKNSFGAYNGFEQFVLDPSDGQLTMQSSMDDPESWNSLVASNCHTLPPLK